MTPPTPLRLLPAPPLDAPYDDETDPPVPLVVGSLALAFPAPSTDAVPLRLVPPATPFRPPSDAPDDGVDEFGHRSTPLALPDAGAWTQRLALAVVEVLGGARTASQLSRYATLEVLERLERGAGRLARREGATPAKCPRLSSLHVCEPRHGVVEACAVIDTGRRRRAVALRLEGRDGRWQCTELELG